MQGHPFNRRHFLQAAAGAALATSASASPAVDRAVMRKRIPSTGAEIPALGMGSWLTFDVGGDAAARRLRSDVLRTFFDMGGRLIDSSPMYGSSQGVIGWCLEEIGARDKVIAADKVWTPQGENGPAQIARSLERWGVGRFNLLQVHNLVDWRTHLRTLYAMRDEGRIDLAGVTTYAGLRHDEMAAIVRRERIDFIQLTCNIADREAEKRLIPLAADRGVAVIANRPFREGALFDFVRSRTLPAHAADIGATTWAQYMLKYVISHPAITCAVPATRSADHMAENMAAMSGPMPDAAMRGLMAAAFASL